MIDAPPLEDGALKVTLTVPLTPVAVALPMVGAPGTTALAV